jgi:hypothetical protein
MDCFSGRQTETLALPDDEALVYLGFEKGRDYLWRIDALLPEEATEDAMGIILSYFYTGLLPPETTLDNADLAVAVLTTACALSVEPVVQQCAEHIRGKISTLNLCSFLCLLDTPFAALVTSFLASKLVALGSVPHATSNTDQENQEMILIRVLADLPWVLLKALIEDDEKYLPHVNPTPSVYMGVSLSPGSTVSGSAPPTSIRAASEHFRFEFAKKVLALRGRSEESVVVTFGSGSGSSGILLVRRGERRPKKVWKVCDL